MNKLEKEVQELEERITKVEVIGEVYALHFAFYGVPVAYYWSKFREKDITDRIDGYIKINHVWYSLDEVVFYRDENRIQTLKKKIEKKKEAKNATSKNS